MLLCMMEGLMVCLELVRANTEAESKDLLSDDEIIAQMRYVHFLLRGITE